MSNIQSSDAVLDGTQNEILEEAEDLKNVTDDAEGEDHLTKPFTISSYGADYTVDSLVKRFDTGSFFVPPFQRSLVWNVKQASRFIESLLMGLPVPGIFVFREAHTTRLLHGHFSERRISTAGRQKTVARKDIQSAG
jgi:hypothetical protein